MKDYLKLLTKKLHKFTLIGFQKKLLGIEKIILSRASFILLVVLLIELNTVLFGLLFYYIFSIIKIQPLAIAAKPIDVTSYPYFDTANATAVSARAYIIYDKNSRVVVASNNEDFNFQPASTTKIMTALVALDYYSLGAILPVKNINTVEGSKMKLIEGEEISVENLLYGLLLPSGNDAAFVLASNYPGGIHAFVEAMNKKASDLSLQATHFTDPSGLGDTNVTSAFDLARLASYALENATISTIVKTKNIVVTDAKNQYVHPLANLNELLNKDGVIGVKTGFTEEAGGVLVTSYVHNKRTYVIVVLKSEDRFFDSDILMEQVIKKIQVLQFT